MKLISRLLVLLGCVLAFSAGAQETIRIGMVAPFTGPFASTGQAFRQGAEAYMALHGEQVGGRKVEMVYRDSAGADATLAKRLAEELIVKDKAALLMGFFLSPEVAATAPVVNASKTPLFMTVAATPALMKMSPYLLRMGFLINQPSELAATYAREQGKSRAFVAVADYGPGHLVEQAFISKFTAAGGQIVGNVRIPLNTADFAPFAERIANANPDMLEVFLPPGAASVGFIKALAARGLTQKVLTIGHGEADDADMPLFDDSLIGYRSIVYYDANAGNAENAALAEWLKKNAGALARPSLGSIGTFDGMHLAYKMIRDQAGKPFNGEAAVKSLAGYSFNSPRGGPVTIDAESRELVQNFYLREVVKGAEGLKQNKVLKTWSQVRPPPLK
jgi:branched-chain amino acid transport system substrate-binding protein